MRGDGLFSGEGDDTGLVLMTRQLFGRRVGCRQWRAGGDPCRLFWGASVSQWVVQRVRGGRAAAVLGNAGSGRLGGFWVVDGDVMEAVLRAWVGLRLVWVYPQRIDM